MYEIILKDRSKYTVNDMTLYTIFGERKYIKTIGGVYVNIDYIMVVIYRDQV